MKNWQIICTLILLSFVLFNRKTRLLHVFTKQLEIYRNDRTKKISIFDLCTFIVIPILVAIIVAANLPYTDVINHAGTIITVFSLIATLPLSFLALMIDKVLEHEKKRGVAKEAFVSITIDIIYSLLIIALLVFIVITALPDVIYKIVVGAIAFFVVKIVLNILMILKRVFNIWEE